MLDDDLQFLCCCTWGDVGNLLLLVIAVASTILIIRKLFL